MKHFTNVRAAQKGKIDKKKHKKKKGHWGVDVQKTHPWDIDIEDRDEPKVAATNAAVIAKQPKSRGYASEARTMRRKSES